MKKVLVAGATGYLGHYVCKVLQEQKIAVRVLARNPDKFKQFGLGIEDIRQAEVRLYQIALTASTP